LIKPTPDCLGSRFAVALAAEEAAHLRNHSHDLIERQWRGGHLLLGQQAGATDFVRVEE